MPDYADIQSIRNFKSLVRYLRKHLDWPLDEEQADDLTFDYLPADLVPASGLKPLIRDRVLASAEVVYAA